MIGRALAMAMAMALVGALALTAVAARAQTGVPGNGGQAQILLPPPPPSTNRVRPTADDSPTPTDQSREERRHPWRELTDSLLDMMAPRLLLSGEMLDDPMTTGFGNADFVEPPLMPQGQQPAASVPPPLPDA